MNPPLIWPDKELIPPAELANILFVRLKKAKKKKTQICFEIWTEFMSGLQSGQLLNGVFFGHFFNNAFFSLKHSSNLNRSFLDHVRPSHKDQ